MTDRKTTARKPLMKCRKGSDDVKTAEAKCCGISSDGACIRAERHPALRWREPVERRICGTWEPSPAMRTEKSQVEEP
jgi:hypothetical protein